MRLQEAGRSKLEASLYSGWFSERFAREERLQGPQHYVRDMLEARSEEDDEAAAEAVFHRMAADWGLEIEAVTDPAQPIRE